MMRYALERAPITNTRFALQVSRNVREMVECVFPEAVARRRAEEAKVAATDALHTAIFCEPAPALLKVKPADVCLGFHTVGAHG